MPINIRGSKIERNWEPREITVREKEREAESRQNRMLPETSVPSKPRERLWRCLMLCGGADRVLN